MTYCRLSREAAVRKVGMFFSSLPTALRFAAKSVRAALRSLKLDSAIELFRFFFRAPVFCGATYIHHQAGLRIPNRFEVFALRIC